MQTTNRNISVLARGCDRWIFVWGDHDLERLGAVAGRYAEDEDLEFTWWDTSRLMKSAREMVGEARLR